MNYEAGNRGPKVKSDCHVTLMPYEEGGVYIDLDSKVAPWFGNQIKEEALKMLSFYEVDNCKLKIEDKGALSWVIQARIEAAIKSMTNSSLDYYSDQAAIEAEGTDKHQNRFSRLYIPGNSPKMMLNAGLHQPKGVILDLEDAVAFDRKFEARFLVRNALRYCDFYGVEKMVRINQGEMGLEDLSYIVPHGVQLILVPKCESAEDIIALNTQIDTLKNACGIDYPIWLMPIIESARGVQFAFDIASAGDNVAALAIGLEDYTADLGTRRTNEAQESFYARCQVVNAARAAGIQAIDSVFSDVGDMEALARNVQTSKGLGFSGMGCIHPRQIEVIHQYYSPDPKEIEKAIKIFLAFKDAESKGLGVVSIGTKMIDPPVVKRAVTTIELAIEAGKLEQNWEENYV